MASQWLSSASSMPAGPHAHVCRSAKSATTSSMPSDVEHAVGVGVLLHQRDSARSRHRAELVAEDDVGGGGSGVHDDHVLAAVVRLRSIPMTGVTPLPAVRNRILSAGAASEGEFACGLVELDDGADGGPPDQVIAHLAVGDGLHGDRDGGVGRCSRSASTPATAGRRRRRRRCGRTDRGCGPAIRGPA